MTQKLETLNKIVAFPFWLDTASERAPVSQTARAVVVAMSPNLAPALVPPTFLLSSSLPASLFEKVFYF
jgi:hypothetical protein